MDDEMTPERRHELADAIGHLRVIAANAAGTAEWFDQISMALAQNNVVGLAFESDEHRWELAEGAAKLADMFRHEHEHGPRFLNTMADLHGIARPPGPSGPPEPGERDELADLDPFPLFDPDGTDDAEHAG